MKITITYVDEDDYQHTDKEFVIKTLAINRMSYGHSLVLIDYDGKTIVIKMSKVVMLRVRRLKFPIHT